MTGHVLNGSNAWLVVITRLSSCSMLRHWTKCSNAFILYEDRQDLGSPLLANAFVYSQSSTTISDM